jgi:putative ABC transport system substrate-binding protein
VKWWKKQVDEVIPMKVISLITLVLGLFLAPCPSQAQSVAKTPRIGILTSASDPHPILDAFRQGLRDLGYVEGQSIALEYRFQANEVLQ